MLEKFTLKNLRIYFASIKFKANKLRKEIWPINWSSFKKPKLVLVAFVESPYPLKAFFLITSIASIISVYFLFLATYTVFTKEVPDVGGEVREATDGIMKNFNPILEPNSEAERRVANLLYHPLYKVSFPDFLNTKAESTISPVLIKSVPKWQDLDQTQQENRYRVLRFELKDNIKWSDNTAITLNDVEYSFERLKEPKSNSQFKDAFAKVEFAKVSDKVFDLRSTVSNPQLIYLANFSPISQNFYENQSTERLVSNFNSAKPTVTSGYFTFTKDLIRDPDSNDNTVRDNPIRSDGQDGFSAVVLNKNPVQNTNENLNVDRYIFKTYANLFDVGGASSTNIERAAKSNKIDLFSRQLSPSTSPNSKELQSRLDKLGQKTISTNNYYNIFLNIKRNDLFINQVMRKYVVCNLIQFSVANTAYFGLEDIPKNKKIIPIQFGQENMDTGCPQNTKDILDGKTFKLEEDLKTGVKRVLSCTKKCTNVPKLTMVGFAGSDPLLTDIQTYLRDIGLPTDVIKNPDEVNKRLETKDYSLAFLPINMVSKDPYPYFGAKSRDLSQIRLNNNKSITDAKIEDNLLKYSISNLEDNDSKNTLINFFKNEYVNVNMFRSKLEINFSSKINNLKDSLPSFGEFTQLYSTVPNWYEKTKRQFKF